MTAFSLCAPVRWSIIGARRHRMLVDASAPNPLNAARSLDAQTQPRDCHVSESWLASGASAPISVGSESPAAVLSDQSTAQRGRCREHQGLHPIPYTQTRIRSRQVQRSRTRAKAGTVRNACVSADVGARAAEDFTRDRATGSIGVRSERAIARKTSEQAPLHPPSL